MVIELTGRNFYSALVIAVSASVLGEQGGALLADDRDDFVAKPFHAAEIVNCLLEWTGALHVRA